MEEEVMRKSHGMGNPCAMNQSSAADHGYLSYGGLTSNSWSRVAKRGKEVRTVEEQVRATAEHKLGVTNQSITAGFFDNNTSAEDRREYLESLYKKCKKEETTPVLDDDSLNDLLARRSGLIDNLHAEAKMMEALDMVEKGINKPLLRSDKKNMTLLHAKFDKINKKVFYKIHYNDTNDHCNETNGWSSKLAEARYNEMIALQK